MSAKNIYKHASHYVGLPYKTIIFSVFHFASFDRYQLKY